MADDIHVKLTADADFRRLADSVNEIKRAVEQADRAAARSMQSPRAMQDAMRLTQQRAQVERRAGTEIEQILKRRNVAERDFYNAIRASTDAQRLASVATRDHGDSVSALFGRYASGAAVVAGASKAFMEFANQGERMRVVRARTGETREAIGQLQDSIEATAGSIGMMEDEVADAFDALRENARMSVADVTRIGPIVANEAKRMGLATRDFASMVGQIMSTMNISAENAGEAINIISSSLVRGRVNAQQFQQYAGMIGETLDELGERGLPGLARGMAMFEQMSTGAFGNTQRSMRTFQSALNEIRRGGGVAHALGFDQRQWARSVQRVEAQGGNLVDVFMKRIEQARRRGVAWDTLFPNTQMRRFWQTMINNQDQVLRRTRDLTEESRQSGRAIEEGPLQAWQKLQVAINNAFQEMGKLLDTIGASEGLKEVTALIKVLAGALKDVSDLAERVSSSKWMPDWMRAFTGGEGSRGTSPRFWFEHIPNLLRGLQMEDRGSGAGADGLIPLPRPRPRMGGGGAGWGGPGYELQNNRVEEDQAVTLHKISDVLHRMEQAAPGSVTTVGGGRHRLNIAGGGGTQRASLGGGAGGVGTGGGPSDPGGIGPAAGAGSVSPGAAVPGGGGGGGGGAPGGGGSPAGGGSGAAPSAAPSGAPSGGPQAGGGGAPGSAAAWDARTRGTPLEGQWSAIEAAARANGVPPAAMGGVVLHETGNGRNTRGNNVAGLMDPRTRSMTRQQFGSIGEGITAAGRTIGRHWQRSGGDLDRMGARYAPQGAANDPRGLNRHWPSGVRRHMAALGGGDGAGAPAGGGGGTRAGTTPPGGSQPNIAGGGGVGMRDLGNGQTMITTSSGARFRVGTQHAPNFVGFLRDYEAAGGHISPQHAGSFNQRMIAGTNTPSLHGRDGGRAIDINIVGRGRFAPGLGGLPGGTEQEEALARRWGLRAGSTFRSPDRGHYEVNDPAAAARARQAHPLLGRGPMAETAAGRRGSGAAEGHRAMRRGAMSRQAAPDVGGGEEMQRIKDMRAELAQPVKIPVQMDSPGTQFVRPGIDRAWKNRVAREESWNSSYDIGVA